MNPIHLHQAGVFELITQSGIMAKFVLLVLTSISVLCWAIIVTKWKTMRSALIQDKAFTTVFWSGKGVDDILSKITNYPNSPIARVFQVGIKELRAATHPEAPVNSQQKIDQIYRALLRTSAQEISNYEHQLGWLATTASAAPFIGLFGTVWGIMNAFQNIGATGAANLAIVAPGISEALITTAAGIGAAIPAVIGYNFFTSQLRKITTDLEGFSQDFILVVQKSNHPKKGA